MVDEKFDRIVCSLERISELEKLMTGEGQNPIANTVMLPHYQSEHNGLVGAVNSYLAKNYSGNPLSLALDMHAYMLDQQKERIEEVHAEYARKAEQERKDSEKLIQIVDKFTKDLEEINKQLNKAK